MCVAVDQRRGVEREVEDLVAVNVVQRGPVAALNLRWVRLEVGAVAGVAARQVRLGLCVQGTRTRRAFSVLVLHLLPQSAEYWVVRHRKQCTLTLQFCIEG